MQYNQQAMEILTLYPDPLANALRLFLERNGVDTSFNERHPLFVINEFNARMDAERRVEEELYMKPSMED